jgi:hypothetical protein
MTNDELGSISKEVVGLTEILSRYFPEGAEENHGKNLRIVCFLAVIQTKHLLNRSLQSQRYENLLDTVWSGRYLPILYRNLMPLVFRVKGSK